MHIIILVISSCLAFMGLGSLAFAIGYFRMPRSTYTVGMGIAQTIGFGGFWLLAYAAYTLSHRQANWGFNSLYVYFFVLGFLFFGLTERRMKCMSVGIAAMLCGLGCQLWPHPDAMLVSASAAGLVMAFGYLGEGIKEKKSGDDPLEFTYLTGVGISSAIAGIGFLVASRGLVDGVHSTPIIVGCVLFALGGFGMGLTYWLVGEIVKISGKSRRKEVVFAIASWVAALSVLIASPYVVQFLRYIM